MNDKLVKVWASGGGGLYLTRHFESDHFENSGFGLWFQIFVV